MEHISPNPDKPHPPKILFAVTTALSLRLLGEIPRRMAETHWEVHIVTSPGVELQGHDFSFASVHQIKMQRNFALWADGVALLSLVKLLLTIRPTVVSAGTPKAGFLGILAAWLAKVPRRVYVLRGLRSETLTGVHRFLLERIEAFVGVLSTHILPVSLSLATRYSEIRGVSLDKLTLLGFGSSKGVDELKFIPYPGSDSELLALKEKCTLEPRLPVVGYIGRMSVDKGLYFLREASNALHMSNVTHQILLVGKDELNEGITNFLEGFFAPTVYFPHTEEVREIYWVLDCLCLPTLREGFPNVVLEAAASGTPVVATNATGACDSVEDGVTGLLAIKADPASLTDKLRAVIDGEVDTQTLSRNARANIEKKYTQVKVTANNLNFYQSLLDSYDAS